MATKDAGAGPESLSASKNGGLLWGEAIDAMAYPQWVIDQIIPAESVSMLYGRSGKGKSFWGLDMALSASSGKGKWNGRTVKPCPVVYVAGEGRSGYMARVQAWERQNRMKRGAFGLYPRPVRLWRQPESVHEFIDEVNASGQRPGLLVFDTLGTCLSGADENNNGQMREVLDSAEEIGRAWDASVLLVHHTGKVGETPRGAQALQDGVAMHAHLTGDGKTWGMLSCGKQKDAEPFEPIRRTLHRVSLDKGATSLSFADDYRTGQRDQTRRQVSWAAVREILEGSGIPMTPKLVATALKWDRKAAGKQLERAEERGEVWQPEAGTYALVAGYVPNVPNVAAMSPDVAA
jgi:hypothetical protein